jgi:hypothetical protein
LARRTIKPGLRSGAAGMADTYSTVLQCGDESLGQPRREDVHPDPHAPSGQGGNSWSRLRYAPASPAVFWMCRRKLSGRACVQDAGGAIYLHVFFHDFRFVELMLREGPGLPPELKVQRPVLQ